MFRFLLYFALQIALYSIVVDSQDWTWQSPAFDEQWTSGTDVTLSWLTYTQNGCVGVSVGFSLFRSYDGHEVIDDITKPTATTPVSTTTPVTTNILGSNQLSWSIPLTVAPAQYWLVQNNCPNGWVNRSNVFTICGGLNSPWGQNCPILPFTTAPPDLSWQAPVSSDTWVTGSSVVIEWLTYTQSGCITSGVGISLVRGFDAKMVIPDITAQAGLVISPPANALGQFQYTWNIPLATIPPGEYWLIQSNCPVALEAVRSPVFTICGGPNSPFGAVCPTPGANESVDWEWLSPVVGGQYTSGTVLQLQWLVYDQTCIQPVGFELVRSVDDAIVLLDITHVDASSIQPTNQLGVNSYSWTIPLNTIAPSIYRIQQTNCAPAWTNSTPNFIICTPASSPFGAGCPLSPILGTAPQWVWQHPVSTDIWRVGQTVQLIWFTYVQQCIQPAVGLSLWDYTAVPPINVNPDITTPNASMLPPPNQLGLNTLSWTIPPIAPGWYFLQQTNCPSSWFNSSGPFQICDATTCPPPLPKVYVTSTLGVYETMTLGEYTTSLYDMYTNTYSGYTEPTGGYVSASGLHQTRFTQNAVVRWGWLFGSLLLALV